MKNKKWVEFCKNYEDSHPMIVFELSTGGKCPKEFRDFIHDSAVVDVYMNISGRKRLVGSCPTDCENNIALVGIGVSRESMIPIYKALLRGILNIYPSFDDDNCMVGIEIGYADPYDELTDICNGNNCRDWKYSVKVY